MRLYEKITSTEVLASAWQKLNRRNRDSSGFDDPTTIHEFALNLPSRIKNLSQQLSSGVFHFSPARGVTIPKPNGKRRPLRVFNVGDRVVQRAILDTIELYFKDVINNKVSFAYVQNRSLKQAVNSIRDRCIKLENGKIPWVIVADINNFFEEIDRDRLKERIFSRLPDPSLNQLITESIEVDIGNRSTLKKSEMPYFPIKRTGISQGSILAPFYSNAYLSEFDKFLERTGIFAVRWADDLCMITNTQQEADTTLGSVIDFLKSRFELVIHPKGREKGAVIYPSANGFEFLGLKFSKRSSGYNICPSDDKIKDAKYQISYILDPHERWPLVDRVVSLSYKMDGWVSSYKFCDVKKFTREVDACYRENLKKLLSNLLLISNDTDVRRRQLEFLSLPRTMKSRKRKIILIKSKDHSEIRV